MNRLAFLAALLLCCPADLAAQSSAKSVPSQSGGAAAQTVQGNAAAKGGNPWTDTPPASPNANTAAQVKSKGMTGGQSPLNPTCEGKNGVECVRSAEALNR